MTSPMNRTTDRSRAAWTRLFTTHGLPCDDALLATFVGRRGQESLAEHVHLFPGHTPPPGPSLPPSCRCT